MGLETKVGTFLPCLLDAIQSSEVKSIIIFVRSVTVITINVVKLNIVLKNNSSQAGHHGATFLKLTTAILAAPLHMRIGRKKVCEFAVHQLTCDVLQLLFFFVSRLVAALQCCMLIDGNVGCSPYSDFNAKIALCCEMEMHI